MKSHLVLSLSRLAVLTSLSACSAGNGTLFDELSESNAGAAAPPSSDGMMSAEPRAPVAAPAAVDEDVPHDIVEAAGESGLPLVGNVPRSTPAAPAEPPSSPPGTAEPAQPEPPAAAEVPSILSVSPADGAIGVASDRAIVIEFSGPMDREATEAAYQSENVPSDSVSFIWNDASTELTVVPDEPLAYARGSDPAEVQARRVSFFVSASAADVEGRRLAQPYEFSFSLLRQIEFTLFAVQDRDLSGSFRSDDSYGTGACARGQINMCVGDTRVVGQNEQYRGFISFDLAPLPEGLVDLSAVLSLEITDLSGNPFAGLGALLLEHASFDAIDLDAFSASGLDEVARIAVNGRAAGVVSADVSSAFLADRGQRDVNQYRLRFETATDRDLTSDMLLSTWDTQTIDVSYLLP
jgi:hypothetical protein